MKIIECEGLTKKYGRKRVLDDLTFTLEDMKLTGLIGRNGVGKTTLLKIISGFIQQTSGDLRVFSEKPFNSLFVSANRIMVDDQMIFPPTLTLADLLEAGRTFYSNWDPELANRLCDYFSIDLSRHHHQLSKGTKTTFNNIVGLSSRCALTIFDEPTVGLDAAVRKDFYRAVLKDYLAHPRAMLISSHHLNEIDDLLEDVLLLKEGKAHLHLPISELKEWAIGVQGKAEDVKEWIGGREMYHQKGIGTDGLYAVVKNDIGEAKLKQARQAGLHISPVSASDICVYVTSDRKEGIDDVFK